MLQRHESSAADLDVAHDDLLRSFIDGLTEYAVLMLDPKGRIRGWNRGAEQLAGWRAEEVVGESFAILHPEEDARAGKPEELLRRAAQDGHAEDQGWCLRKDGSRFLARVVLTALRGPDGELIGFGNITFDATEATARAEQELQAERALRASQESFRLVVENVRDYAIFMLDPEGRVTTWNAGAERLKQYAAHEIVGRHFAAFYPPEDVAAGKPQSELDRAAREGRAEDQGWRVRKDGSRFLARVVITPLRDSSGALRGFAKVTNDVTEAYTAAEHVLRVIDETGRLLETPGYRERLQAVARLAVPVLADWCAIDVLEEGVARRVAAVHADPARTAQADAAAELRGPVVEVLRTGTPFVSADAAAGPLGADERELLRRLDLRALVCMPLAARGRILGAITFGSGIAGRYHAHDLAWVQAMARVAASAMENALLLEEAEQAAAEARAAVAVRDAFLSVASHELRTPLNTLNLQVQSYLRSARRAAAPRELERLQRMEQQVTRLATLIGTLLDVSRMTAGRVTLEPVEMDLAALAREVLDRDEELARSAGCELVLEATGPLLGRWDRLRLDQVLTNLLGNALKFGAGKPVRVSVEQRGERARLTVADQGIGIAPEDQPRIFERFERAVSNRSFGGFGLGLWIVREFVQAHGGEVWVESAPDAGTRFVVELPRAPAGCSGEAGLS